MGGKGKSIKGGKAHQKPSKSSNFNFNQNASFGENKLMTFDLSNSFAGIRVENNEKANLGIDSNLEITFRKMTKKDPTTKLKALKDFIANLQQLDINEKAVEVFGKLYVQLSMDVDNLVRENVQNALMAMITNNKITKESLVIIKIFPYLLISMYDTHPVTATVAQGCFEKVFSSQDVSGILEQCQKDVLENFTKNITVLNAQSICNTHSYSPEECQAKYERVLIGSLKGYGLYVEKISKESLEEMREQNIELIQHERFLTLYKNKSPYIKSAYFETLSSLLLHAPELLKHIESKLAALIFKAIDESDPSISSHVWTCVLLTQIKIDKWWTHINIKLFFEKLFMILRSCNNASLIFPNLLPLISNFKNVFIGNQLDTFHSNLMKNIHHGLTNETQLDRLKSEFSSIICAYFEILQFIIMHIVNDENASEDEKEKMCNRYMDDYMIATIFWCLNNKKMSFPRKLVYQQIAKIVNYFSNNTSTIKLYDKLFTRFWDEIYQILDNGMETNHDLQSTSISHVEFIKNIVPPRKKQVRIESDSDSRDNSDHKNKSLHTLVQKLCRVYIDKINSTLDSNLMQSLKVFFDNYQSSELFAYLIKEYELTSAYGLYEIFEKWLLNEELQSESVVDVIVVLFKFMNNEDKLKILMQWNGMKEEHKNWILLRLLETMRSDENVINFLKSCDVSTYVLEIANLCEEEGLKVLRKCFQPVKSNYPITDESCQGAIDIMCKFLQNSSNKKTFNRAVKFLIEIFPIISLDKRDLQTEIFLSFFECSLNHEINDEDLLWNMIATWNEAIDMKTLKINAKLVKSCIEMINEKIGNIENLTSSKLDYFALIISTLIKTLIEDEKEGTINELLQDFFPTSDSYFYLNEFCSSLEILQGRIFPRKSINTKSSEKLENKLNEFLKHNLIAINVIFMITSENLEENKIQSDEQENFGDEIDDDDDNESEPGEIEEDIYVKFYSKLLAEESLRKRAKKSNFILVNKFCELSLNYGILNTLIKYQAKIDNKQKNWILYLEEKVKKTISRLNDQEAFELLKASSTPSSIILLSQTNKYKDTKSLLNDALGNTLPLNQLKIYEAFVEMGEKKILPLSLLNHENSEISVNVSLMRMFIKNYFNEADGFNVTDDKDIIAFSLNLLNEIIAKQKNSLFLMYKKDINEEKHEDVLEICSIMNFLCEIIIAFPTKLNELQWDFVRLALSNWTLSSKKSYGNVNDIKIQAFIISIYKLTAALLNFIEAEKTKSSSQLISSVIDEWQAIFSTDVNTLLLQVFMEIIDKNDLSEFSTQIFIDILCRHVAIDFNGILRLRSSIFSLQDCLRFSIKNLSNKNTMVCIVASKFISNLTKEILKNDQELLVQNNSKYSDDDVAPTNWHSLELFKETLDTYQAIVGDHVDISSLRLSENNDITTIPSEVALTYLLLWNSILNICADSPIDLRSVYINWISKNRYHESFITSLFDMMPRIIVKSPDMCTQIGFLSFSPHEPKFEEMDIARISSFLYSKTLRVFPVLVRKWWHSLDSKFAQIVDKITTHYVSPSLCTEELNALITKKEKDGNMNIRVLMHSREVIATYGIENAKMELQLKLASNHPLGVIKVESKKHLGGKLQGFEIVKQLSIYLSHQNGRLADGLDMWKRNLDKKYEGVEECFICYSVVHMDNLQLPKLSCKACKKKFHSTCLYRWFSSSNKSSCPLCRSDF